MHHVRQALARLQHGAQLAVVRRALAHVLELDLDVRVGRLEHLDGLVGAGRPRPDRDRGRLLELGRHVDFLARRYCRRRLRRHRHCRRRRLPQAATRAAMRQTTARPAERASGRCRADPCYARGLPSSSSFSGASPRAPGRPMLPEPGPRRKRDLIRTAHLSPPPASPVAPAPTTSSTQSARVPPPDLRALVTVTVSGRSAQGSGAGRSQRAERDREVRGPAACRRRSLGRSRARAW